jgi:hypothetical protein
MKKTRLGFIAIFVILPTAKPFADPSGDPNWGRAPSSIGNSPASLDQQGPASTRQRPMSGGSQFAPAQSRTKAQQGGQTTDGGTPVWAPNTLEGTPKRESRPSREVSTPLAARQQARKQKEHFAGKLADLIPQLFGHFGTCLQCPTDQSPLLGSCQVQPCQADSALAEILVKLLNEGGEQASTQDVAGIASAIQAGGAVGILLASDVAVCNARFIVFGGPTCAVNAQSDNNTMLMDINNPLQWLSAQQLAATASLQAPGQVSEVIEGLVADAGI